MGGSPGTTVLLAAALVAAELYLLAHYFRRNGNIPESSLVADRRRELGHIVMLAAMIGMAVPALNPLPPIGWIAVLAVGVGWFGHRTWRALTSRIPCRTTGSAWCTDDLHPLIGYLTMGYLVLVEPMRMPGGSLIPSLVPGMTPAPVLIVLLSCYFLAYAAHTGYRTLATRPAGRAEPSTGPALPGIPVGTGALTACRVVMALAMIDMLALCWPANLH